LCGQFGRKEIGIFFSFNAEALWNLFQTKFDMPSYGTLLAKGGPIEWVQFLITFCNAQEQKYKLGLFFMFWWSVWKKRNRHIF
jgi:hypothetical protein